LQYTKTIQKQLHTIKNERISIGMKNRKYSRKKSGIEYYKCLVDIYNKVKIALSFRFVGVKDIKQLDNDESKRLGLKANTRLEVISLISENRKFLLSKRLANTIKNEMSLITDFTEIKTFPNQFNLLGKSKVLKGTIESIMSLNIWVEPQILDDYYIRKSDRNRILRKLVLEIKRVKTQLQKKGKFEKLIRFFTLLTSILMFPNPKGKIREIIQLWHTIP